MRSARVITLRMVVRLPSVLSEESILMGCSVVCPLWTSLIVFNQPMTDLFSKSSFLRLELFPVGLGEI